MTSVAMMERAYFIAAVSCLCWIRAMGWNVIESDDGIFLFVQYSGNECEIGIWIFAEEAAFKCR